MRPIADQGPRTSRPSTPASALRTASAIRAFNEALHADARVDLSLVPIGDGLTLARKV